MLPGRLSATLLRFLFPKYPLIFKPTIQYGLSPLFIRLNCIINIDHVVVNALAWQVGDQ